MVTQGWALVWSDKETALAITQELIVQLTGVLDIAPRMSGCREAQDPRREGRDFSLRSARPLTCGQGLFWYGSPWSAVKVCCRSQVQDGREGGGKGRWTDGRTLQVETAVRSCTGPWRAFGSPESNSW